MQAVAAVVGGVLPRWHVREPDNQHSSQSDSGDIALRMCAVPHELVVGSA